jgi:hypothetical protein
MIPDGCVAVYDSEYQAREARQPRCGPLTQKPVIVQGSATGGGWQRKGIGAPTRELTAISDSLFWPKIVVLDGDAVVKNGQE